MPMKIKEIEKEALRLSPHERALLVEHLIGSLEPDDDPDAARAWIEEAERRYQEYKRKINCENKITSPRCGEEGFRKRNGGCLAVLRELSPALCGKLLDCR